MLVVADFSGSIHNKEDDYNKRALASAMEVFGGIGSNTAFGFGTD